MKNVLHVLGRDLLRLLKAPAALVVVVVLVVLPSTYTWFNVIGFWNPYDNTGNMRVCVVNQDAGSENDLMGQMNLGNQIVDTLHENNQLKWEFTATAKGYQCPECGNHDPATCDVVKRLCGYLGNPNKRPMVHGRQEEIIHRKKHITFSLNQVANRRDK